ncbi:hypothetical protein K0M31_006853 [Melipona bicolor]|uniref:Ion transport domain-containing protein n=1 Tax=Melipona bicolor TaxID=60889 RepID=A0AA40KL76_9HYME|nr:hypothetical protein K0M31_006853 [Melipona bicolor]
MVFAIFMVLVPILLLNMLIAMMGNTYAHVIEQSEKEWVKQWAKIVVSLERAVSQKDAQNYLQEYSIKLGPGDDPNNPASEQRGVLVIKSKSKTKAKQRKGAVANWKRVGKVTINELKKRGITGEELRRIMWGRASFSTPVRIREAAIKENSPIEGFQLNVLENSFVILIGIKKKNESFLRSPNVVEPQVSVVTAGFGDALTAALDVMAFAHDFDLSTATEGIPTNIDMKHSKSKTVTTDQAKSTTNNQEKMSTNVQPQGKLSTEIADNPANDRTDINKMSSEPVGVHEMNLKNASPTFDVVPVVLELVFRSRATKQNVAVSGIVAQAFPIFWPENNSHSPGFNAALPTFIMQLAVCRTLIKLENESAH